MHRRKKYSAVFFEKCIPLQYFHLHSQFHFIRTLRSLHRFNIHFQFWKKIRSASFGFLLHVRSFTTCTIYNARGIKYINIFSALERVTEREGSLNKFRQLYTSIRLLLHCYSYAHYAIAITCCFFYWCHAYILYIK